jgi:hypothetical protein
MTGTSISNALLFAAGLFSESGVAGLRAVIDISGDGPNNSGPSLDDARRLVIEQGLIINGLPIVVRRQGASAFPIDAYYEDCVIGGAGAFAMPVGDLSLFMVAIRRKLILEIAAVPPRVVPAAFVDRSGPTVDCRPGDEAAAR